VGPVDLSVADAAVDCLIRAGLIANALVIPEAEIKCDSRSFGCHAFRVPPCEDIFMDTSVFVPSERPAVVIFVVSGLRALWTGEPFEFGTIGLYGLQVALLMIACWSYCPVLSSDLWYTLLRIWLRASGTDSQQVFPVL